MKISIYLDEDSQSSSLVQTLLTRGVDVITARQAAMLKRSDAEQLEWAAAHGRVLFSSNIGDFYGLHTSLLAQGRSHAGIILAQQQHYSVGDLMRRLLKLIASKSAEEMQNQVEFLSAWGD